MSDAPYTDDGASSAQQVPAANTTSTPTEIAAVIEVDQTPPSKEDQKPEVFRNQLTFFLSVLGCAVGTGNIWRFSRIVSMNSGENGAGMFLCIWAIFLITWSIPLILVEYGMGRKAKQTTAGAYGYFLGNRYRWMGMFIGLVNLLVTGYYSVINGWCLYYLIRSIIYELPSTHEEALLIWDGFQSSYWPLIAHIVSILLGAVSCFKGVATIEKVNLVLVPGLLLIMVISTIRAVLLPGALEGVKHVFFPDLSVLLNPNSWLDALTQNAWDTNAGGGLFTTYATYMQETHSVVWTGSVTPALNNVVSVVCAITTFSTTFSLLGSTYVSQKILDIMKQSGPASTGLTFIWFPQLFYWMPGGRIFCILFFTTLTFGSLSSLISMIATIIKLMTDEGIRQQIAVVAASLLCLLIGIPSAMSTEFLANQDYVWGSALVLTGFFEAFLVIKYGVRRFRETVINTNPKDSLGRWWDFVIAILIPLQSAVILCSWIVMSIDTSNNTDDWQLKWYNPFGRDSLLGCVLQWLILITVSVLYNALYLNRFKIPYARTVWASADHIHHHNRLVSDSTSSIEAEQDIAPQSEFESRRK